MPEAEIKYGCLIFDDPRSRGQGWKALEEGEATRVNMDGTASLNSDYIWLTNMTYSISSNRGLDSNYRFLRSEYLREDLDQIFARYNINSNDQQAEFGAKLINRSIKLTAKLLGHAHNFSMESTLNKSIKKEIGFERDPCVPEEIGNILEQATACFTNCERDYAIDKNEEVIATFRIPPREHCLKVLDLRLPYGEFAEVPKAGLPPQGADRETVQQFLRDTEKTPGLFKITCEKFNPDFNGLINFGSSRTAAGPYRRSWVTYPEAAMLSAMSDMRIHQAYLPKTSCGLTKAREIAENLPWQAALSMTVGIFFENLWTGMSVRQKRPLKTDPNKVFINIFSPYIRAQDRLELFNKAVMFKAAGYDVKSYSTGRLKVNVTGHSPLELYLIALSTDMIPPCLGLSIDDLPEMNEEDLHNPLRYLQMWHATSSLDEMMEWDLKVVNHLLNA